MTRYRHLITDSNRKWWTLGAMCFALFMIMLDNTVVNVALPSIERDLGVSLFSISSATAGFAPDTTSLVVSRVVQGIGGALMMPATLSIVTNAFPPEQRGMA